MIAPSLRRRLVKVSSGQSDAPLARKPMPLGWNSRRCIESLPGNTLTCSTALSRLSISRRSRRAWPALEPGRARMFVSTILRLLLRPHELDRHMHLLDLVVVRPAHRGAEVDFQQVVLDARAERPAPEQRDLVDQL